MSRVAFLIDFTVQGKVELASRASISKAEALKIDGLTSTGQDTIIRLSDPSFEDQQQKKAPRQKKKDESKSPIVQQADKQSFEDEDEDDVEVDLRELENIEMDMEDRLIEGQMNGDDEDDSENLNGDEDLELEDDSNQSDDNDEQIIMNFGGKKMTKRQLGYLEEPIQLPNKATRQKKKIQTEGLSEQEMLKKLEKEERRRQHMRKQIQAQKMETVEKILNETGRKQRQRNERENKERAEKQNKTFRQIKDVPKTVIKWTKDGCTVTTYETLLFPFESTVPPRILMKPQCELCGSDGKYKVGKRKMVCSLPCYKKWKSEHQT